MGDRGRWIAVHLGFTGVSKGGELGVARVGERCREFSKQSGDQNAQVGQGEGTSGGIDLVDGRWHGARIGNRAEMVNSVVFGASASWSAVASLGATPLSCAGGLKGG